jgi:uncharacterized protein with PIN domain
VALFPFGRTIHCSCGERVGLAPQRRLAGTDPPRFLADAMLGRLARWLRLLGFDTAYEAELSDSDLVRRALEEERWILTRDRALPVEWRVSGIHVLRSEALADQLRDVVRAFRLASRVEPFSRCGECNAPLAAASRAEVSGRVPPRVLATARELRRCPGCERVYWRGSHTARMKTVMDRILADV